MSTATPGNINAVDILRSLEARATARDWRVVRDEGHDEIEIHGAGLFVRIVGERNQEDAQLIVEIRNTLPEIIRSMDNRDFRIHYLEQRVRELEEQLATQEGTR